MKLLRYLADGEAHYGILDGDLVYRAEGNCVGSTIIAGLIGPLSKVRLLAPCVPTKIIAVGLNYRNPSQDGASVLPEEPILSLKPPSAIIGTGQPIIWPHLAQRVDFEGEIAIVIGETARNVAQGRADQYILGLTCANDVTARDIQRREGQWMKAKGFDTFCPLGPIIDTQVDPDRCELITRVNGEIRQSASATRLHYHASALVSYCSRIMTLCPGDLILTGTPPGSGPLRIGDTVEVEIPDLGILRNPVISTANAQSIAAANEREEK